jgi:hypothetical protein
VNEDLEVVVICIEDCRLTKKYSVFSMWVPPYCRCAQGKSGKQYVDGKRTMVWYRIDPFIQSGVKFGDNVLFPLLSNKPKQRL